LMINTLEKALVITVRASFCRNIVSIYLMS
jgi:hypothetical protein